MHALAGACYCLVHNQGPQDQHTEEYRNLYPEQKEAHQETFHSDLVVGVLLHSRFAQVILDGDYDQHYEPVVSAQVPAVQSEKIQVAVHLIAEFKEG
jgi:hypothetical protein